MFRKAEEFRWYAYNYTNRRNPDVEEHFDHFIQIAYLDIVDKINIWRFRQNVEILYENPISFFELESKISENLEYGEEEGVEYNSYVFFKLKSVEEVRIRKFNEDNPDIFPYIYIENLPAFYRARVDERGTPKWWYIDESRNKGDKTLYLYPIPPVPYQLLIDVYCYPRYWWDCVWLWKEHYELFAQMINYHILLFLQEIEMAQAYLQFLTVELQKFELSQRTPTPSITALNLIVRRR